MPGEITSEAMEQAVRTGLTAVEAEKDTICGMMALEFYACDWEKRTLTLSLTPAPWMTNPLGIMHGGLVCSAMDTAMGTLSFFATGQTSRTPTVTLQTTYVRPVPLDREILIRAHLTSAGRSLISLTSELWVAGAEGRILATSSGTYFRAGK